MDQKLNNQAHPDRYHHIEAVIRMSQIKRWHMVDTSRQQTLAEHSCNVALLAVSIAVTAPHMYFGEAASVIGPALTHDLGEAFTGDIPTPTKRADPKIREIIDKMEFKHTPKEFMYVCDQKVAWLIKLCDLADGIRFIRRYGHGDAIAKHAQNGLEGQIEELFAAVGVPVVVKEHVRHQLRYYIYEMS